MTGNRFLNKGSINILLKSFKITPFHYKAIDEHSFLGTLNLPTGFFNPFNSMEVLFTKKAGKSIIIDLFRTFFYFDNPSLVNI